MDLPKSTFFWTATASTRPSPRPSPQRGEKEVLRYSEPATIFAWAFHIADTAIAQLRMCSMRADIVATVPATHALGGIAHRGRYPHVGTFQLGQHCIGRLAAGEVKAQVRGDEEEA